MAEYNKPREVARPPQREEIWSRELLLCLKTNTDAKRFRECISGPLAIALDSNPFKIGLKILKLLSGFLSESRIHDPVTKNRLSCVLYLLKAKVPEIETNESSRLPITNFHRLLVSFIGTFPSHVVQLKQLIMNLVETLEEPADLILMAILQNGCPSNTERALATVQLVNELTKEDDFSRSEWKIFNSNPCPLLLSLIHYLSWSWERPTEKDILLDIIEWTISTRLQRQLSFQESQMITQTLKNSYPLSRAYTTHVSHLVLKSVISSILAERKGGDESEFRCGFSVKALVQDQCPFFVIAPQILQIAASGSREVARWLMDYILNSRKIYIQDVQEALTLTLPFMTKRQMCRLYGFLSLCTENHSEIVKMFTISLHHLVRNPYYSISYDIAADTLKRWIEAVNSSLLTIIFNDRSRNVKTNEIDLREDRMELRKLALHFIDLLRVFIALPTVERKQLISPILTKISSQMHSRYKFSLSSDSVILGEYGKDIIQSLVTERVPVCTPSIPTENSCSSQAGLVRAVVKNGDTPNELPIAQLSASVTKSCVIQF